MVFKPCCSRKNTFSMRSTSIIIVSVRRKHHALKFAHGSDFFLSTKVCSFNNSPNLSSASVSAPLFGADKRVKTTGNIFYALVAPVLGNEEYTRLQQKGVR